MTLIKTKGLNKKTDKTSNFADHNINQNKKLYCKLGVSVEFYDNHTSNTSIGTRSLNRILISPNSKNFYCNFGVTVEF